MSSKVKYFIIAIVIFSFLFFGIYSTILAKQPYVAKVAGQKITLQEFNKQLSKQKQAILTQVGSDKANQAQAIEFIESDDFKKITLNEMINKILIRKFLNENGIDVIPETLLGYIQTLPEFQSDGKFDKSAFEKYAKIMGFNEYGFLKSQVPMVYELIFNNIRKATELSSQNILKEVLNVNNKFRTVSFLKMQEPQIKDIPEEELRKLYEKNKNQFIEKPHHYVTVAYIDDYISQNDAIFSATPEAIRKFYNHNFSGKVVNFFLAEFSDESEAIKAQSISQKQGVSLSSVVETIKQKPTHSVIKSGEFSTNQNENSQVLQKLKLLKIGEVSHVIKNEKSFAVVQVLNISNQKFQNFSNEALSQEIKKQRKCNNAKIYAEKLQSEFKAGASFEAVLLKYGLPVGQSVIIDESDDSVKNQQTNTPVVNFSESLKKEILHNKDSNYGYVFEYDPKNCSFAAYKQTLISKERIKTLPEVRGLIVEMYKKQAKVAMQKNEANTVIEQIKALKTDLEKYSNQGLFFTRQIRFNERDSKQFFEKKVGESFIVEKDGSVIIAYIQSEGFEEKQPTEKEIDEVRAFISNSFAKSYTEILIEELYKKYKVSVRI